MPRLQAVRTLDFVETYLGSSVRIVGVSHRANTDLWVRAQVTGTNPTTIRIKVWADGTSEPLGWPYSATDSSPLLQSPGGVGLRAYLGSGVTNAPITFSFDDFQAVDPNPPAPSPTPTPTPDPRLPRPRRRPVGYRHPHQHR